jgi:hypothetical protein
MRFLLNAPPLFQRNRQGKCHSAFRVSLGRHDASMLIHNLIHDRKSLARSFSVAKRSKPASGCTAVVKAVILLSLSIANVVMIVLLLCWLASSFEEVFSGSAGAPRRAIAMDLSMVVVSGCGVLMLEILFARVARMTIHHSGAARSAGTRSNLRYFLWIFAALNLLPGAGYFLFSGILGLGDWNEVIRGAPHQVLLRLIMTIFGAGLYVLVVRQLAVAVEPYCPSRPDYNTVGRVPYYGVRLGRAAAVHQHAIRGGSSRAVQSGSLT